MPRNAAAGNVRIERKAQLKIAAVAILALSCLHPLGWNLRDSGQALASQGNSEFCEIKDPDELLKRVGEEAPADAIKLVGNKEQVNPGMLVQARLVNTTQLVARFGAKFRIQRYGRVGWMTDSSSPNGPWPRKMGKLSPDQAAGCYRFAVPDELPSGRYRFLTRVYLGSAMKNRAAEFIVSGGQPASSATPATLSSPGRLSHDGAKRFARAHR